MRPRRVPVLARIPRAVVRESTRRLGAARAGARAREAHFICAATLLLAHLRGARRALLAHAWAKE
ncbi:hypothetical protein [Paraburkholderia sp. J8-2]|uniref:hypothetical protein n=1 Tax=Paraburkholderia sp. J8-2 TaxID=2805440 RepID=UPI002AB7CD82|nr:hypothetical protein [Paraburkholderia sp. J8-2]